jgi:hypothetical protein
VSSRQIGEKSPYLGFKSLTPVRRPNIIAFIYLNQLFLVGNFETLLSFIVLASYREY